MASLEAKIYDKNGKEVGSTALPREIFGIEPKASVIHEVVVAQQANARSSSAHTKTRGEVRGGGKKPWKQKGTGRARHGSIRSPLWIGGGVTFGPRNERNYTVKINHKTKQKALKMVLSDMAAEDKIVVVEALENIPKTKNLQTLLSKLPWGEKRIVLALDSSADETIKAARNLDKITLLAPDSLNVIDMLRAEALVASKHALETIITTLTPQAK